MPLLRIGHRGAPHVAPANTMASFRAAVDAGCDWVECDCRPAADGVIVLAHDDSVADAAGKVYRIEEHDAAALAALDLGAGEGVPSLEELVTWAAGRAGVMADVKRHGHEKAIGAALEPLAEDAKLVPGADAEGRRRFRALFPALPLSLSLGKNDETALLAAWDAIDTDAATLEHPLITPARVTNLHQRGIRVFAWTVDDLATMRRLAEMGVDGLISNRADLLAQLSADDADGTD